MNKYSLIKHIGAGAFGSVYLAKSKEDEKQVVVKERLQLQWHLVELARNKSY